MTHSSSPPENEKRPNPSGAPPEGAAQDAALKHVMGSLRAMHVYERFEQIIVLALTGIIALVTLFALLGLGKTILDHVLETGFLDFSEHATFQLVFGMIMTVIIALEFSRATLLVGDKQFGVVQARVIVLIGLLAIVRKVIILDLATIEPLKIMAIAAASLALGLVYWLVRDQDHKEQSPAESPRD